MEFIKKIFSIFKKAKDVTGTTKQNIRIFVQEHKKQIRLMITLFEAIFPAQTGARKMACLVTNICCAIGLQEASAEVADFVEKECQKVYNDFKSKLN